MTKYVFIITYNFDGDYISKVFDTYEEAEKCFNEYLDEEVDVTMTESEYEPTVIETNIGGTYKEVVLVYEEDFDLDWNFKYGACGVDMAHYRIFEIEV